MNKNFDDLDTDERLFAQIAVLFASSVVIFGSIRDVFTITEINGKILAGIIAILTFGQIFIESEVLIALIQATISIFASLAGIREVVDAREKQYSKTS